MVDKSEKFNWLVRVGYFARGLTYLLLGYIALSTAGKAKAGATAVYDYLQTVPLGTPLLYIMALGLLAYAGFKFLSAIGDIQHRGSDTEGLLGRVGDAASGAAHVFLAYAAYQFASGAKHSSDASGGGQQMVGTVLDMKLGAVVIGIVGIGFLGAAFMQAKKAYTAKFMNRISSGAPQGIETVGRIGHAARAIVFLLIGWSMIQSAWLDSSSRAQGLGEAILSLRDTGLIYNFVAVGLIMFGLFSLVTARYRIIPDFGPEGLKPKFR